MMLAADKSPRHFDEWVACGGDAALKSYGPSGGTGKLSDVPAFHWQFIKSCRAYYETDTHLFVHANAFPDVPLSEQPDYMLYWEHFNDPAQHESGRVMICGHTPQRDGTPRNIGHAICIDTYAHGGGWLTCLDVASGRYWQANENEVAGSFLRLRANPMLDFRQSRSPIGNNLLAAQHFLTATIKLRRKAVIPCIGFIDAIQQLIR